MCGVVVSFVRAWGDREGEGEGGRVGLGDSPGGIRRGRKRGGGGRREEEKKEKERGESNRQREGIFALVIVFFSLSLYSTPISLSSFRALRREKARAVGKEKVYSRSSFFFFFLHLSPFLSYFYFLFGLSLPTLREEEERVVGK